MTPEGRSLTRLKRQSALSATPPGPHKLIEQSAQGCDDLRVLEVDIILLGQIVAEMIKLPGGLALFRFDLPPRFCKSACAEPKNQFPIATADRKHAPA